MKIQDENNQRCQLELKKKPQTSGNTEELEEKKCEKLKTVYQR